MLKTVTAPRPLHLAFLLFLQCACSSVSFRVPSLAPAGKEASAPAVSATASKEEAAIQAALAQAQTVAATYKICPADLLEISVYQEKDLERKVRVGPDGLVTLPLAGSVKVGGLSVPQAEQAILNQLRRYVINPQVSVFIKEYGNKLIYVLGEVQKPGSYALPTEASLSVLEAVTLAGGFTQYSAGDRTRVIRKNAGKTETITIPLTSITKGGDKSRDIPLEPNDVVYVPETIF